MATNWRQLQLFQTVVHSHFSKVEDVVASALQNEGKPFVVKNWYVLPDGIENCKCEFRVLNYCLHGEQLIEDRQVGTSRSSSEVICHVDVSACEFSPVLRVVDVYDFY